MGSAITTDESNPGKSPDSTGASGALTKEVLDNIISDNERVRAAFTSPEGLTRVAGDEQRHVGYTVVMVVTDERVAFVSNGSARPSENTGSLAYGDLAAVGVREDVLEFRTTDGVAWRFPLPEEDPDTVDAVVRHLRWVGELRNRIVACRNDVELGAGEIRDHADEMAWEEAEATYEALRDRLDEVICAVQWTTVLDDEVIAPELTPTERTLERAYARLLLQRSESEHELGRQLIESDEYEQAGAVLESAQRFHERARDRVEAVKRSDAFQFGEQRELRDDIDRLGWEIETAAAEPIRHAHEAKIIAENAEDTEEAVDWWETAFRRYGNVLSLDLGDRERQFAGDKAEVRAEMQEAAERLLDGHLALARERWNAGVENESAGEVKAAIRLCNDAIDHVERAVDLAEEFSPEDVEEVRARLDRMQESLRRMRATATVQRRRIHADEVDVDDAEDRATAGTEEQPTAGDIADIDTHHDIQYELDGNGDSQSGERSESSGQPESGDQSRSEGQSTSGDQPSNQSRSTSDSSKRPDDTAIERGR